MGRVTLLGCGAAGGVAAPVVYNGPGSVPGWNAAYGFWGLRAYDSSKIGANCIDICSNQYDTALNPFTIHIGTDGYLNESELPAYRPIYIAKLYDQCGSPAQNLSYIFGVDNRPTLAFNKVGGRPAMFFNTDAALHAATASTALAQPISVAAVVITGGGGMVVSDGSFNWYPLRFGASLVGHGFGIYQQDYNGVANSVIASYISIAASTPLPNGASSTMSVNGVNSPVGTPGNIGPNGINSAGTNKFTIGGNDSGGALLSGYVFEVLVKAGKKDNTEQAAMTTNHHTIGTGWT